MDDHTKGEELGLATEGAMLTEVEIKALAGGEKKIDFPMPGEVAEPAEEKKHSHQMPDEGQLTVIEEKGQEA